MKLFDKIKLNICFFIVFFIVFLMQFNVFATSGVNAIGTTSLARPIDVTDSTNKSQEMERYVEEIDNTEYEKPRVITDFLTMLASYDREKLEISRSHYNEGFNSILGSKIYFDAKGNIKQDIRSISNFNKYAIAVNRKLNQVTVYGYDDFDKAYNTPVVCFPCTCNQEKTKVGRYYTKEKYRWQKMLNSTWAQYAIRFTGNFLFHSTSYNSPNIIDLNIDVFNQLTDGGKSDGCVRLKAEDAYWLYKNLQDHALVVIYDNDINKEPFDRPQTFKITDRAMTFDPTDPAITGKW